MLAGHAIYLCIYAFAWAAVTFPAGKFVTLTKRVFVDFVGNHVVDSISGIESSTYEALTLCVFMLCVFAVP